MPNDRRVEHLQFMRIKPSEQWRLYIDGHRQDDPKTPEEYQGRLVFDQREPGYIDAMMRAHDYISDTMNDPLTPEHIIELHRIAVGKVGLFFGDTYTDEELSKLNFRGGKSASFGLSMNTKNDDPVKGNASIEGLRELLQDAKSDEDNAFFMVFHNKSNSVASEDDPGETVDLHTTKYTAEQLAEKITSQNAEFLSKKMSGDEINKRVKQLIASYEKKMEEIGPDGSRDDKLNTIIKFIQKIEQLHTFEDGNARTKVMGLLRRELIKHGFDVPMLDNPNRFDLFSTKELRQELENGWKTIQKFQSDIAHLPAFEALHRQAEVMQDKSSGYFFKTSSKKEALALGNLLKNVADQTPEDALTLLQQTASKEVLEKAKVPKDSVEKLVNQIKGLKPPELSPEASTARRRSTAG